MCNDEERQQQWEQRLGELERIVGVILHELATQGQIDMGLARARVDMALSQERLLPPL